MLSEQFFGRTTEEIIKHSQMLDISTKMPMWVLITRVYEAPVGSKMQRAFGNHYNGQQLRCMTKVTSEHS